MINPDLELFGKTLLGLYTSMKRSPQAHILVCRYTGMLKDLVFQSDAFPLWKAEDRRSGSDGRNLASQYMLASLRSLRFALYEYEMARSPTLEIFMQCVQTRSCLQSRLHTFAGFGQ